MFNLAAQVFPIFFIRGIHEFLRQKLFQVFSGVLVRNLIIVHDEL